MEVGGPEFRTYGPKFRTYEILKLYLTVLVQTPSWNDFTLIFPLMGCNYDMNLVEKKNLQVWEKFSVFYVGTPQIK